MPSLDAFAKAEDEYYRLKGKLDAKRLSPEEFNAAMRALMVEHGGRYWTIGVQTGKWYVHDGHAWSEADPATATTSAASAATSAATSTKPSQGASGATTATPRKVGVDGKGRRDSGPAAPAVMPAPREGPPVLSQATREARRGPRAWSTVLLLFVSALFAGRVIRYEQLVPRLLPFQVFLIQAALVGVLAWALLEKAAWPRPINLLVAWLAFLALALGGYGYFSF